MGSEQLNREIAGYNGARSSAASLAFLGERAACPYPQHRATDWHLAGGPAVCGICHPPAAGIDAIPMVLARSTGI